MQSIATRLACDRERREKRGLEQDVAGGLRYPGISAPHDPRYRECAFLIGNHQGIVAQRDLGTVEQAQLFVCLGHAYPDAAIQLREIETVHRLSEFQKHVVGDVDHGRDGAQSTTAQFLDHPVRRPDGRVDTAKHTAQVTRACIGRFQGHCTLVFDLGADRFDARRSHRLTVQHPDLTCDPGKAETVGAVWRQVDVDTHVVEREILAKTHPDRRVLRREMALNKLTDLRVCQGLMLHQLKYWREYLDCRDRYAEWRWEAIIADPIGSVQWVGRQLGLDIGAEEAHAIWTPMDHRNLLMYHKHNYRKDHGILGDWLNHLHATHIDMARALGLVDIAAALGYDLDAWHTARPRSAFQDELDYYLRREQVAPMQDPVLAGFCFNKSNIDASAFNFKSFPGKQWTYVERSTFTEDAMVLEVLECAETGCQRINAIVQTLATSPTTDAESLFRAVEPACRALVCDDIANGLLTGP